MDVALVSLIAFAFGFLGSMPLAGPVAVLIVSRGVQKEYGAALRIGLGAALAEAVYALLAFWGFAPFLGKHPRILPISHGVTAVLLVVLGVYFLQWKGEHKERSREEKRERRKGTFMVGFTISALNPTLLITWSAATTMLYSKQVAHMESWMAIPFGLCAGAGVAAWDFVLVWLLKRFGDRFPKTALAWAVRGMGLLLFAIGAWSAVQLVMSLTKR